MSVLFPKVNRPRAWDYRPIYYDPEKEKLQKLREKQQQAREEYARLAEEQKQSGESGGTKPESTHYVSGLHRGSFREARELTQERQHKSNRQSRIAFWIALLLAAVLLYWLLG
ncbi:MAG: hypothetical protein IJS05_01765 [Paludibacteraceae bacterium]|nr:hypothetical protein [Paludibacteraceae bacterium]